MTDDGGLYEQQSEVNVARNNAMLTSLGLATLAVALPKARKQKRGSLRLSFSFCLSCRSSPPSHCVEAPAKKTRKPKPAKKPQPAKKTRKPKPSVKVGRKPPPNSQHYPCTYCNPQSTCRRYRTVPNDNSRPKTGEEGNGTRRVRSSV